MQYTLDSVEHVISSLSKIFKSRQISKYPFISTSLIDLSSSKNNTFYFGVLTNGNNVNDLNFYDENNNQIVSIESNSQIILLFSSIDVLDSQNNKISFIKGQFRGYELIID